MWRSCFKIKIQFYFKKRNRKYCSFTTGSVQLADSSFNWLCYWTNLHCACLASLIVAKCYVTESLLLCKWYLTNLVFPDAAGRAPEKQFCFSPEGADSPYETLWYRKLIFHVVNFKLLDVTVPLDGYKNYFAAQYCEFFFRASIRTHFSCV